MLPGLLVVLQGIEARLPDRRRNVGINFGLRLLHESTDFIAILTSESFLAGSREDVTGGILFFHQQILQPGQRSGGEV